MERWLEANALAGDGVPVWQPFAALPAAAQQDLNRIAVEVHHPEGTIVFREGTPCRTVVIVESGEMKLSCSSKEGKTHISRIARAGTVLGLSAALSNREYELTAEARTPVDLKSIRREELVAFLQRHAEASMDAARALSVEYKSAFQDVRSLALTPTAGGKLATVLLALAPEGSRHDAKWTFTLALSHDDLGNMAGITRETVTRELGKFRKQKLIEIRGSTLEILDPGRLALLVA